MNVSLLILVYQTITIDCACVVVFTLGCIILTGMHINRDTGLDNVTSLNYTDMTIHQRASMHLVRQIIAYVFV